MNRPDISIIMPAYNVERYIDEAISSVIKQTYKKWELIIVNDCCTDNTWNIINKYKDERIIKLQRTYNSGSAYIPREDAVKVARGEWIVNLDADDYIESTNLQTLLKEAINNNVDICTPQMIIVDEMGNPLGTTIPANDFDFDRIYKKNETFNLTVPEWKIGMNGSLVKKTLWEKSLKLYQREGKRGIHDDENLSRILMFEANGVISSRTKYFIRTNPASVTKKFSINSFGWMESNNELRLIAKKYFGVESEEYQRIIIYDYYSYKSIFKDFGKNILDKSMFIYGLKMLKKWHNRIEWPIVLERCGGIKTKIFHSYKLSLLYMLFRYPQGFRIGYCCKMVFLKLADKFYTNKYYKWFVTRKKRERLIRGNLERYYLDINTNNNYKNFVICIYDGVIQAGGLADRLKGIIGIYYIAKKKGIPFKLYFKKPFPLEEFFVPNLYDWKIEKPDICLDKSKVDIIVLDTTQDNSYQMSKQKKYLERKIKTTDKQIHVYSNAGFSYGLDYAKLFNELFKPSEKLQTAIEYQKVVIGKEYISISCRFLNLLDDFNETYGYERALSNIEKSRLLSKIDTVVKKLHFENPEKKILVNSDSITFLDKYKNIEYTYVIPGNITHIDAKQDGYIYENYEKTFLDFMMIANAEKIYLIKSDIMYKSGYPYAASKIYNKPFEIIKI